MIIQPRKAYLETENFHQLLGQRQYILRGLNVSLAIFFHLLFEEFSFG